MWSDTYQHLTQPSQKFLLNPRKKTLNTVDSAEYLGVTISSDLSWTNHVNNITKKANSTLSFLRRYISSCPAKSKINAYNTYVRPSIEYASSVWAPYTDCLINQLEMVQRRAARFVKHDYSGHSSVTDMLTDLKWDTLSTEEMQLVYRCSTRLKTT